MKFSEIVWTDSVIEWHKNCYQLNSNQENGTLQYCGSFVLNWLITNMGMTWAKYVIKQTWRTETGNNDGRLLERNNCKWEGNNKLIFKQ